MMMMMKNEKQIKSQNHFKINQTKTNQPTKKKKYIK